MSRTRNSYIPLGVLTRGMAVIDPFAGVSRAALGRLGEYPEGYTPVPIYPDDDLWLLSTQHQDKNGIQRLLHDEIVAMCFADVRVMPFANPDKEYTGYAASGFWYTLGKPDPTHLPYKATWASEGESSPSVYRSDYDRFPDRIIAVATRKDVVIFDADDLTVWMRFLVLDYAPPANGPLMGKHDTVVRGIRFINGFLVIATTNGLRLADFRRDRGYLYRSADTWTSILGIYERNSVTYLDGADITVPSRLLLADECTCLDGASLSDSTGAAKNAVSACAVGHPTGLTGVTLHAPLITYPAAAPSTLTITAAAMWWMEDEGSGEDASSWFRDSGTNWTARGVRPGDEILTDIGTKHSVTKVLQSAPGDKLLITPKLGVAQFGLSYTLRRRVDGVGVSLEGQLYFADGPNKVTLVPNTDWFEVGNLYGADMVTPDGAVATVYCSRAYGFATSSGGVFTTTDQGVMYASADAIENGGVLRLRYAATDVDTPDYVLLPDAEVCVAIAVDPDSTNLLVAAGTNVHEIDQSIHQVFRSVSSPGTVRSLLTFRNPYGPPTLEVS